MSYYGFTKTFTAEIAANATNCTIMVGTTPWQHVYLRMPTFSTGADLEVHGSWDGTTYYRATRGTGNTATSGYNPAFVGTGSSGYLCEIPNAFYYYKFVVTGTVCAAASFPVVCVP